MRALVLLLLLGCERREPVIVFVCDHGSVKSAVAARVLEQRAAERGIRVRAIARGLDPDPAPSPVAIAGLRAEGLPPPTERPRRLERSDVDSATRVVGFGPLPARLVTGVPVELWTDVPSMTRDYATARAIMGAHIDRLLDDLAGARGQAPPLEEH